MLSVQELIEQEIEQGEENSFIVMDLAVVRDQLSRWRENLPRVEPFMAVKCCPDPQVMRELALLGCGFDVASETEMNLALSMPRFAGFNENRIIFANPCKQTSHIRAAAKAGVRMTTFDNMEELHKIHNIFPDAELVVRILGDDSQSICRFNEKFGVALEDLPPLLTEAARIGANVIGVSFHVGSGCQSIDAFVGAVLNARKAFNMFIECGLGQPKLLDLGGGWPGALKNFPASEKSIEFEQIAAKINPILEEFFPKEVQIIAEPGRYFVHAAGTVVSNLIARRKVSDGEIGFRYYINDGVYGSFNCLLYDHREGSKPHLILDAKGKEICQINFINCSIWGNTCDGIDCIVKSASMPEVSIGSWFIFPNMGAYTTAAASTFNGFAVPKTKYANLSIQYPRLQSSL